MQKARKQLFATLKSVASNEFVTFVQEQATTAEKLEELFDGIPAKDHPELGDLLNKYVTSVITISKDNAAEEESDKENSRRRSNNADDDDEKKFSKKEVAAIRSASRVVTAFVKNSKRIAPESVYTTVCTLHDLLLVLGDDNRALQADICELCELWYHQQRDGREALVPQTIYYLVCKTLDDESPKVADLKRLYALKEGLSLIDFAAPSSVALKQLLQRCVVHPFFLMKDEGKKLLSYLFTISAPLVDELHRTIKSGITTAKKSQLDAFAEIYLRAWKSAQGACLVRIEHNCLQDLIHHSIHVKNTRILKAVQHILARIVEEKVRIKQLDDLLTRLYEPIIWRSLKVANPRVRCNAAIQLGYVFPLLPANLPPRLMQEQLEEQLEHVKQLQNDPVPLVRVKGVLATGRILSLYWELVPTVYQSSLLLHLIDELAFDASDYRVREAVFQALRLVLDNHLSHGFLKAHLPRLAVLMHDSSEKVRLAFVLLLNEIKRIKAIKFWEVVPIDHLLARLREESLHSLQDGAALTSVESSKVVEGLVALLSDTYFPVKKPASQWVIRCIALVEADHMAALEFFRALAPQLVPSIAVKFIGKLFKKILVPWYKLKVTGVASKPSNDDASEVGEDDQEPNAKRAKTTEVSLSAQDSDTATALTEIIVTILEPVSGQLQEKEHQPLYKILTDVVDDSALLMATKAAEKTSPKMLTAVWTIARHMPVENCPKLLKHVTALVTKNISSDTDSTAGASRAALRLLTSWGKTASILGRMTDKLNNSTIDHVIADAELRDWLLHEDQIQELIVALHEQWTSAIEASLESRETDEEDANSALRLMTTYWRLLVHVAGTASQEIPSFGDFVDWTEEHVISFTEKRQSRTLQHMVERVLLTMFTTLTDVITMRIVRSGGVIGHVLELAATVVSRASHLSTETVMQVIGCSFKLIYQLYHRGDTEEDSSIIPHKKCLKLVDDTLMFLRDQEEVSDEAMARHHEIIRMQDLIVLSKQRSALRSLVNHTLTRVIENIDVPDNLPDELPTTNTGLTYDADFVLTVVGRSAVTTAEFGSFVESYLSKQDVTELLPAAYRVLRAIATMAPNQDKKVCRGDKSAIKATLHNLSHRLARAVTAEESDEELTPQYLTARVEELLVKFNKAA